MVAGDHRVVLVAYAVGDGELGSGLPLILGIEGPYALAR